ncbi:MAG TPA: hypothetical protein VKA91_02665 [Nitrososphaeraceae archaeon]|nr:hypothetical protein [Nitrososphaeraceae archaeon]
MTSEHRLQTLLLLETALSTGNLIGFFGHRLSNPPAPGGRTWAVNVYGIDGVKSSTTVLTTVAFCFLC